MCTALVLLPPYLVSGDVDASSLLSLLLPPIPFFGSSLFQCFLFLLLSLKLCPNGLLPSPPPPQDYFFVRGFAPFAGACLASCPDKHMEVLVGGIAALVDEMAWFKATCAERGMDVNSIGKFPVVLLGAFGSPHPG